MLISTKELRALFALRLFGTFCTEKRYEATETAEMRKSDLQLLISVPRMGYY